MIDAINHLKLGSAILILLVAMVAGVLPFIKGVTDKNHEFAIGEALASGIFLGVGLIAMLGDASSHFVALGYHYPIAFLLAGLAFLLLLLLEHLSQACHREKGAHSKMFALLAVVMLAIHAFLEGAASGLSVDLSLFTVLTIAIIAHKWAASFALAVVLNNSALSFRAGVACFIIFAMMTPFGIIMSTSVSHRLHQVLMVPILMALSSGTFLYLGTLHGLSRAVLIKRCCDLKHFSFVIAGFILMAIVSKWA